MFDPSQYDASQQNVRDGYDTDLGNGVVMRTQASSAGSPSAGYFDPMRALNGGGIFTLNGGQPYVSAFTQKSAWPLWLGIVGAGAAVVLLKGKK